MGERGKRTGLNQKDGHNQGRRNSPIKKVGKTKGEGGKGGSVYVNLIGRKTNLPIQGRWEGTKYRGDDLVKK